MVGDKGDMGEKGDMGDRNGVGTMRLKAVAKDVTMGIRTDNAHHRKHQEH